MGTCLSHLSFGYATIYWRNWLCTNNSYPKWLFVLFPDTPLWEKISCVAALSRSVNHLMRTRLRFIISADHTKRRQRKQTSINLFQYINVITYYEVL